MFHHMKTTEESNTQDECIQSQHYINFKKEEGITENCKLYSTKLTATDLTQENIKAAEVLFNYKFKLFNTNDGERNKADMGAFFRNFSNIQIRNNKELFIFLSETLNWGQNIPFNNDIKFGTNLKIYSNFVSQTSGLLGSCIEGNHCLYTALKALGIIKDVLPIKEDTESELKEVSESACSLKSQSIEVVTLFEIDYSTNNKGKK